MEKPSPQTLKPAFFRRSTSGELLFTVMMDLKIDRSNPVATSIMRTVASSTGTSKVSQITHCYYMAFIVVSMDLILLKDCFKGKTPLRHPGMQIVLSPWRQ